MLSTPQGKYPEAEPLYERSRAIREKVLGPDHPNVAGVLNNQATLLKDQVGVVLCCPGYVHAFSAKRCPMCTSSLASQRASACYEFRASQVQITLYAISAPFQGKYADAEPLFERSQAIYEKVLGPEHPDVAEVLTKRALLFQLQVIIESPHIGW